MVLKRMKSKKPTGARMSETCPLQPGIESERVRDVRGREPTSISPLRPTIGTTRAKRCTLRTLTLSLLSPSHISHPLTSHFYFRDNLYNRCNAIKGVVPNRPDLLMRPFFFLLACALKSGFLLAQTDTSEFPPLRIGEWRQHLPWQRTSYVSQSDSKIYYSTEWAVVEIDKTDRTPRFITKVEGLSDVGINLLRYSKATDALLIAYTNSNLDIYHPSDGTVTNLPFVFKNLNIVGDKKVYSVFFEGKFAYLACGFGILKLNLERDEAEFTTFTGLAVKSVAKYNNYLYAGTEESLFRLPADDVNPEDFSRWQMAGAALGFPTGVSFNAMAVWQNNLYLGIDASLRRYDGTALETITTNPEARPESISAPKAKDWLSAGKVVSTEKWNTSNPVDSATKYRGLVKPLHPFMPSRTGPKHSGLPMTMNSSGIMT